MVLSNKVLLKEIEQQISNLHINIQMLNQELSMLPKGKIIIKKRNSRDYFYLSYSENGKHKTQYIPPHKLELTENQVRHRNHIALRIKRYYSEQSDWMCLLQKRKPIIKTDIVAGYIMDEQSRNFDMLRAYRKLEIDALANSDLDEKERLSDLCNSIEKTIYELKQCKISLRR